VWALFLLNWVLESWCCWSRTDVLLPAVVVVMMTTR